ncbi:MAG: hypothetical protein IH586_03650, partial [Anaerolineaceae bacterium]|nr:hypothetical protein [Anaerolineaceae bacterium]
LKVYGHDGDYQQTSAFVNPATGEMLICTPREINYTPVHELIHIASNPDFGRNTNQAVDEAVTEYFTHRITAQRNVIRSSEYDVLGSTDVIAEIVKIHGEEILRSAYFQTGKEGVEALRQAVDQKLGKGAFARVVELMDQPHAPPKQIALDLLRWQGATKK